MLVSFKVEKIADDSYSVSYRIRGSDKWHVGDVVEGIGNSILDEKIRLLEQIKHDLRREYMPLSYYYLKYQIAEIDKQIEVLNKLRV